MLDLIIIGIIVLFMFIGYQRGLIRTVFSLVSFVLAIMLTVYLYPIVAELLRQTPIYTGLKDYIIRTMGLEDVVYAHGVETIGSLPLPDILQQTLMRHFNTPSMFDLLGVRTIEEFIAGYFAGFAINIIAMVLVFIIVRLILGLISGVLDIVGRLPVIRTFNKGGGILCGLAQGVIVVWIGLVVMNLFFLDPTTPELQRMLNESLVANWIYENNPIMAMLANIR